ncbi:MAG: restriction endonuclease subunit S [Bacteroidota bacterium]|nr:restriction endonuclease subunit S [Odoribacter sp.]MDP3643502.1 restriction endonuclease subunit S [Bacteroidota bacterium]
MRKGWEIKKLGEVCDFQNGFAFKSNSFKPIGSPVLRISNIQNNAIDFENLVYIDVADYKEDLSKYEVNSGDLLIAMSGGTTGKIGINNTDTVFYLNQRVGMFHPKKTLIKPLLYYFLSTKVEENLRISAGSAQPNLSTEQIKSFEIPLPPLPEQQRIVAILDEAFEAIEQAKANAEKNLQNAKELFESYLQGMFESKIHGSKSETLESLCDLIVDCEHKTAPTQETGYPSIRTPNIGKGNLILDGVYRVSHETYLEWTRRAVPQAGDLILAREAPAGNIAVIPDNLEVCLGQRTVLVRPKMKRFVSMYLAYLILSKEVQQRLLSHSHGATVEHVNMKDIRAFKIYNLPTVEEQQRVVNQINVLSSETKQLEENYRKKLESLEELKKSILQKAFSGELTSPERVASENDGCSPSSEETRSTTSPAGA